MLKECVAAFAFTVLLTGVAAGAEPIPITECGFSPTAGAYYYPQPLRCSTPIILDIQEGNVSIDCRDHALTHEGVQAGIGIDVGGTSLFPIAHVVLRNCAVHNAATGLNTHHVDQLIVQNEGTAKWSGNKTAMVFGDGTTWSFAYGPTIKNNTYGVRTLGAFKPRFEKMTVTKNRIGFLAQWTDELSIITSKTTGNRYAGVVITSDTDSSFLDDGPFGRVFLGGGTNTGLGCNFNGRIMTRGPTDGRVCLTD